MGDLVVAGEVDIDQRVSLPDLRPDELGREDPEGNVGQDALQGVPPAAAHPRPDVVAALAPGTADLGDELPDGADDDRGPHPRVDREAHALGVPMDRRARVVAVVAVVAVAQVVDRRPRSSPS